MKIGSLWRYASSNNIRIDNLRIWGEERTLEIADIWDSCLYDAQKGLLAAYDFEDADSTGIKDNSGNGNDATFFSFKASSIVDGAITCKKTTNTISNTKSVNLQVSPNPTSGFLSINTDLQLNKMKILDLQGKTVKSYNQTSNKVDVSDLPNGFYVLQVFGSSTLGFAKFLKN